MWSARPNLKSWLNNNRDDLAIHLSKVFHLYREFLFAFDTALLS